MSGPTVYVSQEEFEWMLELLITSSPVNEALRLLLARKATLGAPAPDGWEDLTNVR